MGDSDVNRRGVKEWLTRSVQSFLRWPKWRIIWEWVQRRLSSLFHPTVPKFLAYFIILLAAGWIFWIWLGEPPIRFYCWNKIGDPPLGNIYSTLITVLSTVSALVLSLMFIGIQIALANFYSPRVIRVYFGSLHFTGVVLFFLGTAVYLAWRMGQAQEWNTPTSPFAEVGFTLFLTYLFLLVPYFWISIRLLLPRHLLERPMWSISANDFRREAKGMKNKLNEKLQPVIDIIRRSTRDGQHRTVEQAFEAMGKRFGEMIRRSKEEPLSNQIAASLSEELFEIGRFANAQGCFEVSMKTLESLKKFLEMYIIGATKRTSALLIYSSIKRLKGDFSLRYDKRKWPVEHDEIEELFSGCKRLITQVLVR